ncbi:hypothetical protein QU487_16715 [Crenobacter sp. SG2305]|uniref:hypothetical protein n=1 Tax=Crenobacter oryzisoli TaxID=3056844 RepID=UPI0025AA4BD8|nr:hypothetical protein [Crenobacter sp. SG2305]MDN0084381.1 hypothetical protein [Crenobacter sp. SG2305]
MRSFSFVRPTLALLLALSAASLYAADASAPVALDPLAVARAQYWKSPYDPAAINALALRLVEAGDTEVARLLLYRAVRIAPDRQDIRANLLRLEAGSRRVGSAPGGEASAPARGAAKPNVDELPPLWPLPAH